MALLRPA